MNTTYEQLGTWLDALRSGDYQQGKGTLVRLGESNSGYEYCCLGVYGSKVLHCNIPQMAMCGTISSLIGQGLVVDNPFTPTEEDTLVNLNDMVQLTFSQIAAFVECDGFEFFTHNSSGKEKVVKS